MTTNNPLFSQEPDLPHPSEVTSPVKTIPLPSLTNGSNEKRSKEEIAAEIRKKKQQIALTNTRYVQTDIKNVLIPMIIKTLV